METKLTSVIGFCYIGKAFEVGGGSVTCNVYTVVTLLLNSGKNDRFSKLPVCMSEPFS